MLERAVIEKPGVHITELVEPLGRTREVICKAVCNLRKLGRLKRSPVPRNHPDYMLLYPPAEIKVVATRNRKPKSADLSTTKA
jgi:predicted transcriptional regulator